jgi:putative transposase
VSLAAFVAAQRTDHSVPHAVACRALNLSESWFYKWRGRPPTKCQQRRVSLDAKVAEVFADSGGTPETDGVGEQGVPVLGGTVGGDDQAASGSFAD